MRYIWLIDIYTTSPIIYKKVFFTCFFENISERQYFCYFSFLMVLIWTNVNNNATYSYIQFNFVQFAVQLVEPLLGSQLPGWPWADRAAVHWPYSPCASSSCASRRRVWSWKPGHKCRKHARPFPRGWPLRVWAWSFSRDSSCHTGCRCECHLDRWAGQARVRSGPSRLKQRRRKQCSSMISVGTCSKFVSWVSQTQIFTLF